MAARHLAPTGNTGCVSIFLLVSARCPQQRERRMLLALILAQKSMLTAVLISFKSTISFCSQIFTIIAIRAGKQRKPATLSRPHAVTAQLTVRFPQRSRSVLVREVYGSAP